MEEGMDVDARDIATGHEIPRENYCDQPYVVVTRDGNWLCVLTTGQGLESQRGQHVVATISADRGRTWSALIDIEPAGEHMSSWVTPLIVEGGRVYAFYCYDHDGRSTQHGGWLCYRYSDDGGRTWSAQRYRVPLRLTRRDRSNDAGGARQYFWVIDKPVVAGGSVFFALPKLYSGVPLEGGEGWVVRSDNLLTESDPGRIHWALLPDGDVGVYEPALGSVQEEQNVEVLSDGSLYMCYRTATGHPAYALSRDGGHTWTPPQAMRYASGNPIKTPRACPRIWKAGNGKFLFWFHNNAFPGWGGSANRNPVWLTGGIEVAGEIRWAQPEILLYDRDPTVIGMSYPDFIEQEGRIWVTETQKTVARVHEIDPTLLEGLWNQHRRRVVTREGLLVESSAPLVAGEAFALPPLPDLRAGGLTLELWIELDDVSPGRVLLSSFGRQQRGFRVSTAEQGALELELHDGQARRWLEAPDGVDPARDVRSVRSWRMPTDEGAIRPGRQHHVAFMVDGRANVVSAAVDGVLCDGGAARIQGWKRLNPFLGAIDDEGVCRAGADLRGRIAHLRIYGRCLRTSEVVSNYCAG
jgi:hypothetical protein